MKILPTPTFIRITKNFHANQKVSLDEALLEILANPLIGEAKVGDLAGVRVYKFSMLNQEKLLAYKIVGNKEIWLLMCRSHENFYRDLKSIL
jgi:hypothetical protein